MEEKGYIKQIHVLTKESIVSYKIKQFLLTKGDDDHELWYTIIITVKKGDDVTICVRTIGELMSAIKHIDNILRGYSHNLVVVVCLPQGNALCGADTVTYDINEISNFAQYLTPEETEVE